MLEKKIMKGGNNGKYINKNNSSEKKKMEGMRTETVAITHSSSLNMYLMQILYKYKYKRVKYFNNAQM